MRRAYKKKRPKPKLILPLKLKKPLSEEGKLAIGLRACLKKGLVMTAPDKRVEARRSEGAY